ncbi:glycosyltransferase family 4 protein [Spirosoma panaciterrae]|uniref:glycosyltransferase family 4 protein n=1 Tax=Spirosoma panaciterrae TaxID=496058 RepID=UPI00037D2376|nr:glycosyltransferase family 1 protein [Spirosoma panaciterrae]
MKIVVNARFLTQPITGTQRFAIELSRKLKIYVPNIEFVCPPSVIHSEIAEELEVIKFGVLRQNLLWEQIELPMYLWSHGNPILLNLCNIAPIMYGKNIASILDLSFHLHPEWFSKQFSLLYNTLIPIIAKRAIRIITISEYSRKDIIRYFNIPPEKIDIVHPSISSIFENNKTSKKDITKFGRYILAVSSIDPRKNFLGLIKAFKLANLNDINLVIVGSKNKVFSDEGIAELIKDDPSVFFTGYVSDNDLASLYKNASLFVYPSFFEGFGIPPLEAMASGCPTIVSNTSSLPEVCGDASLYVDPHDITNISETIKKVINDDILRHTLVNRGYNQFKKFSWDGSAKKAAVMLNNLLKSDFS